MVQLRAWAALGFSSYHHKKKCQFDMGHFLYLDLVNMVETGLLTQEGHLLAGSILHYKHTDQRSGSSCFTRWIERR